MKKFFFFLIVIISIGLGFYTVNKYLKIQKKQQIQQKVNLSNFEKTKQYLINHFKGNYPIPTGNLVLLDKTKSMIHLSNRNIPLSKIKNLYIIQATTCDILKNDKTFNTFNYDPNNSLGTGKNKIKRCFTYSITADRKNFQIGTIVKTQNGYKAKLDGTIPSSITKSYDSPRLVKNGSLTDLPYPAKLSPVVIVKNLSNSKILAKVENLNTFETNKIQLKDGVNYLISSPGKYNISIVGKLKPQTRAKFVDVAGNIVNLAGNKQGLLRFEVKNYEINGDKKDYVVQAGKFLASVLKLAPSTSMEVNHNGTTLVIRGTKFTVFADNENFDTYLALGHITQLIGNKEFDITLQQAFSLLKGNNLVSDITKASKLVLFQVWLDALSKPKYNYTFSSQALTNILTGVNQTKRFTVNFSNGKKITFVRLDLKNEKEKFDNVLKYNQQKLGLRKIFEKIKQDKGRGGDRVYKNLINNICKGINNSSGLDISAFWYFLDAQQNGIVKLKDDFIKNLGVSSDNYVILSNRHFATVGNEPQNSIVLGYNPADTNGISTLNLKQLNYKDNLNYVLVACDGK